MGKVWKMVGLMAGMALVGLLAVTPVAAQEPVQGADEAPVPMTQMWQRMRQWLNRENAPAERPFVDEDGDGVCDVCGNVPGEFAGGRGWRGQGPNGEGVRQFVDEDGDGVCDVCGNVPGEGQFVDQDGDGVCDLFDGERGAGRRWQSEDGQPLGGMMRGRGMRGAGNGQAQ